MISAELAVAIGVGIIILQFVLGPLADGPVPALDLQVLVGPDRPVARTTSAIS